MEEYCCGLVTIAGKRKRNDRHGFTLIELAFVLVIVGLLVGMGGQLLPMLVKQNKLKESRAMVQETKTAIIGYALATGRLPYASSNEDGSESGGRLNGYIPYATLGIRGSDTYTKTLFYAVDPHLTATATTGEFKTHLNELISGVHAPDLFCDSGNIKAAFVVLSSGYNGTADSPNDDNNNGRVDIADNNTFEQPGAPQTASYDDILEAASISYLFGRFE